MILQVLQQRLADIYVDINIEIWCSQLRMTMNVTISYNH